MASRENLAIYKVDQYTEGSIISIKKLFFWDERHQSRIMSLYFETMFEGRIEMGDSGRKIFNAAGNLIGMINAAVVKVDPLDSNRPLIMLVSLRFQIV